jgi:hypothetical protein
MAVERRYGFAEQEWRRFLAESWERGEAPSDEAWPRHLRRAAFEHLRRAHKLLSHAVDPEESLEAGSQAADEIIAFVKDSPFRYSPFPLIPDEAWDTYLAGDDYALGRAMQARSDELQAMPYADYLATPEWAEQRRGALRRAGGRCETCDGAGPLHVHHRTYRSRGGEKVDDLVVLCEDCHLAVHTRGGSHRPKELRPT